MITPSPGLGREVGEREAEGGRGRRGSRNVGSLHTSIENLVQQFHEKISRLKNPDWFQSPAKDKFGAAEQANEHRMISPHREHHAEVPK